MVRRVLDLDETVQHLTRQQLLHVLEKYELRYRMTNLATDEIEDLAVTLVNDGVIEAEQFGVGMSIDV